MIKNRIYDLKGLVRIYNHKIIRSGIARSNRGFEQDKYGES